MYKTILLCTDGSEQAMKAARTAAQIAQQSQACILLLNVHSPIKEELACFMPWQLEGNQEDTRQKHHPEQETILKQTATILDEAKVSYTTLRECGHAASHIVQIAKEDEVDLIVLGDKGTNPLQALILGSVTENVVHNAPCSVLVVR